MPIRCPRRKMCSRMPGSSRSGGRAQTDRTRRRLREARLRLEVERAREDHAAGRCHPVRAARLLDHGLTVDQAASEALVSPASWWRAEQGTAGALTLRRIGRYLGVRPADLA